MTRILWAGPWVNNCVGHHNYGHFVRFLLAVDVACTYHLWMITTQAMNAMERFVRPIVSLSAAHSC